MHNFVLIVDGEVAGNYVIPDPSTQGMDGPFAEDLQKFIAIFSSHPTILAHERVEEGYIYDPESGTFSAPGE